MSKYDERSFGDEKYPFTFQQKIVLRYIKGLYSGKARVSALTVYNTICWIASDFSKNDTDKEVRNWPKTIATYSGIGRNTAQRYIRKLAKHNLIKYEQVRNPDGRWNKRMIILPSELPEAVVEKRDNDEQTMFGEPIDGQTISGEDITL